MLVFEKIRMFLRAKGLSADYIFRFIFSYVTQKIAVHYIYNGPVIRGYKKSRD